MNGDEEAIYQRFKARIIADAASDPSIMRVLTSRPELIVDVEQQEVRVDGGTLTGRIARLLAGKFYDEGATNNATRTELKRTGGDNNNANIAKVLDGLVVKGFMTREGDKYVAVKGMKVRIIDK